MTTSSEAAAFQTTLDLFEAGLALMRQNLRRTHPEAADEDIERFLHEWLLERPGAESGDCLGRRVDVNTRLA
jgi:Rv0078B-related antitoxin